MVDVLNDLISADYDSATASPKSIGSVPRLGHPLLSGGREPYPHRFSLKQMEACASICDTLFQAVPYDDGSEESEAVKSFYDLRASDAGVAAKVAGMACKRLPPSASGLLGLVLWLLSYRLGTLILGGGNCWTLKFPFVQKFSDLPLAQREKVLRSWAVSSLLLLRVIFKLVKAMACIIYFGQVDETKRNKTWDAIGYVGPDPRHRSLFEERLSKHLYDDTRPLGNHVLNLQEAAENDGEGGVQKLLKSAGCSLLDNLGNLKLLRMVHGKEKDSKSVGIECDVVVVGSGSGGGVVAGVLARAGYKVVVLEKGHYFARQDLSLLECATLEGMLENGGILATADGAVNIFAGSTVGGGSAINWGASFKTPPHVLREWSEEMKLKLFGRPEYEEAMEEVCKRAGVQSDFEKENQPNSVLRKGCEQLGYPVGTIPRNSAADHYCGWCCFGCWNGQKQATSETWLVDATQAGAVILSGCTAQAVLHDASDGTSSKSRRARGVVATIPGNGKSGGCINLFIQARATVVACGSVQTPPLLLKSGFRNPNIGKYLHVHPALMVWGYFPDLPGPQYEGTIMSAFSNVCGNWDTSGYGALLQTPALHPASFASLTPWVSGKDFKNRMRRYARTVHLLVLCRDTSSGSVGVASHNGGPYLQYKLNRLDEQHLVDAREKGLRVLIAAGATIVGTQQGDGESLSVQSASPQEIEAYLARVRKVPPGPLVSAHQMGSCRMGADPKSSVVDPSGEAWEAEGLFLGDASVFPAASGVNPMITTQSIAYCTAQSVKSFLKLN